MLDLALYDFTGGISEIDASCRIAVLAPAPFEWGISARNQMREDVQPEVSSTFRSELLPDSLLELDPARRSPIDFSGAKVRPFLLVQV